MMFSFLSLFSFGLAAVDPLYLKMAGQWVGQGERVLSGTHRTVRLEARLDALLREDQQRLNSRSWIRELALEGPGSDPTEPKESVRLSWLQPKDPNADALPRLYNVGFGTGDAVDRPSAQGTFDGYALEVRQEMGGNPSYLVISTTRFLSENETDFVERAFHGTEELAVTRIRYRRVEALPSL